ncbi:MAG TPA: ATP-binding protein [Anaeromyxobacteraceae bacterium]|nr:ATP-binding protein [Anaeromyxobacteraceae bacterium]
MDIRTQAALLAAIVTLALAIGALLRDKRSRVFTLFSLFAFDLFLYSFGVFLLRWPQAAPLGAWADRIATAAGALVPAAGLAFFLEFLGVARRPARRGRNAMLFGSLGGLAVAVTPLVHLAAAKLLVGLYVLAGLAVVLSVLWGKMRSAETSAERARLLYLFVGACVAVALSALDMLPRIGLRYPAEGLGAIALTLYTFFLSQTLQRHRLLDLHEFIGKIVVVTALGAVLAAIYGGLVSWAGDRPELFYFNTLVASFVILSLFEPMRQRMEEWVVSTFFTERYELVRRLERLRDATAKVIDPAGLARVVLDGLVETRRVTHCSLWLVADDRPGYRLLESRGPPPAPFLEPATARSLIAAAGSGGKVILLENIDRRLAELRRLLPASPAEPVRRGGRGAEFAEEHKRLADARAALVVMKAGAAMPLVAGDRLVGFLACWDERVAESFASDEIAALIEVADRCALVIENSKLYQAMKERDRLAALGEMSAGLAHEIRNPLAAIKGAVQYLDPGKLPQDDREFLEIVIDEVNRLNGVVTQFLDYSRPLKPSMEAGDVNEILERTFKLLQQDVPASVAVVLDLAPAIPRVTCDPEQLKQVFLNLALNAFQAMPRGGRLEVSTRVLRDDLAFWREGARKADAVEIRFHDSGPGIPEEARESIFVPFYTTKEKGTGLGLAICQRIVKAHGGTIGVRTPPDGGAEFLVSLPGLREGRPEAWDEAERLRAREQRRARAEARLRERRRRRRQA